MAQRPCSQCADEHNGEFAALTSLPWARFAKRRSTANDVVCKLLKIKATKIGDSAALVGSGSSKGTGHRRHLNRHLGLARKAPATASTSTASSEVLLPHAGSRMMAMGGAPNVANPIPSPRVLFRAAPGLLYGYPEG